MYWIITFLLYFSVLLSFFCTTTLTKTHTKSPCLLFFLPSTITLRWSSGILCFVCVCLKQTPCLKYIQFLTQTNWISPSHKTMSGSRFYRQTMSGGWCWTESVSHTVINFSSMGRARPEEVLYWGYAFNTCGNERVSIDWHAFPWTSPLFLHSSVWITHNLIDFRQLQLPHF